MTTPYTLEEFDELECDPRPNRLRATVEALAAKEAEVAKLESLLDWERNCAANAAERAGAAEAQVKTLTEERDNYAVRLQGVREASGQSEFDSATEGAFVDDLCKTLTEERDAAQAELADQCSITTGVEMERGALQESLATEKTAHLATRREADRQTERADANDLDLCEAEQALRKALDVLRLARDWTEPFRGAPSMSVEQLHERLVAATVEAQGAIDLLWRERPALANTSEPAPCASCVRLREAGKRLAPHLPQAAPFGADRHSEHKLAAWSFPEALAAASEEPFIKCERFEHESGRSCPVCEAEKSRRCDNCAAEWSCFNGSTPCHKEPR